MNACINVLISVNVHKILVVECLHAIYTIDTINRFA